MVIFLDNITLSIGTSGFPNGDANPKGVGPPIILQGTDIDVSLCLRMHIEEGCGLDLR